MSTEMGASPELNKWRLEEVEYWQETGGEVMKMCLLGIRDRGTYMG